MFYSRTFISIEDVINLITDAKGLFYVRSITTKKTLVVKDNTVQNIISYDKEDANLHTILTEFFKNDSGPYFVSTPDIDSATSVKEKLFL